MNKAVTVRLSENQMEFIKKEAAQRDISVSKYIHRILFIGDWIGPTVEEIRHRLKKLMNELRIIMNNKIFPTLLIFMDVCAAFGYIPAGDWRKIVYWLAAATLTYVVTY